MEVTMFALVFAAHGIVGEIDSAVSVFKTHDDAFMAMEWSLDSHIQEFHADDDEFDERYDAFIDEWHASCDEAEWHIYEAEVK